MPLMIWLMKPVWVRLPPPMQDAVITRYKALSSWMQGQVWDRIGWKAKPIKNDEPNQVLQPVEDLLGGLGTVTGLHSDADWRAAMKLTEDQDVVVVVDFTAVWCGPCQKIAPFFATLASKYPKKALFVKVDVDELEDVAAGAEVMAMPTFQIYKKGEKVATLTGASEDKLQAMVAAHAA